MPKRVRLPDGKIGIFGDDESNEQIRAKIEKKFPDAYKSEGALAARGAARGAAGWLADANAIAQTPVLGSVAGAVFPPVQALRLASGVPGGPTGAQDPHTKGAMDKVTEFANAPTPTDAESAGWWAAQVLPAVIAPATGVGELAGAGATRFMGGFARGWATQTGQQIPQAVQDFLSHHATRHLAGVARRTLGVPEFAGAKTGKAALQGAGRTMGTEYERGNRPPENNPPQIPPSGSESGREP